MPGLGHRTAAGRADVVTAIAFVQDHLDRILLHHTPSSPRWMLPSAAPEDGESIAAAITRTLNQHACIAAQVHDNPVGIYREPTEHDASNRRLQRVAICMRARQIGQPRDPSAEWCWVHPDQLAELDVDLATRQRIEHGLSHPHRPVIDPGPQRRRRLRWPTRRH